MARIAFKMQLYKGQETEYKKRHATLWPELGNLLKEVGVSDYSIFLEEATGALFGVLTATDPEKLTLLPASPVMQKWWHYMSDIMATNPDFSPVQVTLEEVFHQP